MYQNFPKILISLNVTKKKFHDPAIVEKSKTVIQSSVEKTITEMVPSKKIILENLSYPVTKNELHEVKKKEIRNLTRRNPKI